MKNIVSFSGGKDSTALILWARENLDGFETIFFDTGWEDDETYKYVEYINNTLLDGKLIELKSDKYDGFVGLSIKKQRIASATRRYCTDELKYKPSLKYINQFDDVHLYVGIRADESPRRAAMDENVYDDDNGHWIHRPLLKWTAKQVFNMITRHGIEPNPLYKMGMHRVGCMPCIMSNHQEMQIIIKKRPDVIDKIRDIETKVGRSFFSRNYIPDKFCTGDSNGKPFPWVDDVVKYLQGDPDQLEMFEMPSCMSYYGLCE